MSENYKEVGKLNHIDITRIDPGHAMKGATREAVFEAINQLLPKWLGKVIAPYKAYIDDSGTIYQLVDTNEPGFDGPAYEGAKVTLLDNLAYYILISDEFYAEIESLLGDCRAKFVKYANEYLNWHGYEMLDDTYTIRALKGKKGPVDFMRWGKFMRHMELWEPETEGDKLMYSCFSRYERDYAVANSFDS